MELHCNAGVVTLTQKGYLGKYPQAVWYYPNGIANILSLRNITKQYRVTMDSSMSTGLQLHKPDGGHYLFTLSDNGLFRLALQNLTEGHQMWSLVTTVADQSKSYTKRQVTAAERTRNMQNILMFPSDRELGGSAIQYLANCPVTEQDIRVASDIFGPNLGSLKGKAVYRPSPHVDTGVVPVPPDILSRHGRITLAIDIMFVNKIPFLVTLSRGLKFITVEDLPNRQEHTVRQN